MAKLSELNNLKQKVETARQDKDRASGALEQINRRLKSEHGCNDLGAARTKLKSLNKEAEKAEADFDKALATFQKEYGDQL